MNKRKYANIKTIQQARDLIKREIRAKGGKVSYFEAAQITQAAKLFLRYLKKERSK